MIVRGFKEGFVLNEKCLFQRLLGWHKDGL
jgi:hypothetical protein